MRVLATPFLHLTALSVTSNLDRYPTRWKLGQLLQIKGLHELAGLSSCRVFVWVDYQDIVYGMFMPVVMACTYQLCLRPF